MTKRSVKSIIAVLMLLTVALYFISGTYARYTDSWNGTGEVEVAKWNVAVTSNSKPVTEELTLEFKPKENAHVVSGKIAPDVELEAELEIDLSGTEVAVDLKAEVNKEQLTSALQDYGTVPSDITVTAKVDGEDAESKAIALPSGQAFSAENGGKKKVTINVKWANQDAHNADDTKAGKAAYSSTLTALQIPVKLTVQQHVLSDD